MSHSPAMSFETALRMWFGVDAFGKADFWQPAGDRNRWLRRLIKALTADVLALDTDEKHRDRILAEIDEFEACLTRDEHPDWRLVFTLIRLVGTLLGRMYPTGEPERLLFFALEARQHYRDTSSEPTPIQEMHDQPTIVGLRNSVVARLRQDNVPDWRIAQVMNTTVYQLKKADAAFPK